MTGDAATVTRASWPSGRHPPRAISGTIGRWSKTDAAIVGLSPIRPIALAIRVTTIGRRDRFAEPSSLSHRGNDRPTDRPGDRSSNRLHTVIPTFPPPALANCPTTFGETMQVRVRCSSPTASMTVLGIVMPHDTATVGD